MSKFTDGLWNDLVREHSATLVHAERPEPKASRLRRPRVLAGSSLGLAGLAAGLVLALGGTAETAPAYAITRQNDGTVFVQFNYTTNQDFMKAETKLIFDYHETVLINLGRGPATTTGPVSCPKTPDQYDNNAMPTGPPVTILLGNDGTAVEPADTTGGGGTVHVVSCALMVDDPGVDSGSGPVSAAKGSATTRHTALRSTERQAAQTR